VTVERSPTMCERRKFEVKVKDAKALLAYASLPVVVVAGKTPGDLIDALWARMARAMKFDVDTVELEGGTSRRFTAVSTGESAT
jgi:hypothetical protein